ncbi:hypothetical protein [Pinisolibacter sp.]|uniref:hypothetical protein n=1 Tax=Pinisolibacter sp. TaxID=2172024 RepID=UPI002FDD45FA
MRAVVKAAVAYFAVAFATGFVLGSIREIVVVPRLGGLAAVAIEAPIMLAISWIAATRIVRRCAVPADAAVRLAMGGLAFVLLQAAEVALASALGTSPVAYAEAFATPRGLLGLAAQILFAIIPLFVDRGASRR